MYENEFQNEMQPQIQDNIVKEVPVKEKKSQQPGKGGQFLRKAMLSISLGLFFGLFAGIGFVAVQQGFQLTAGAEGEETIAQPEDEIPTAYDGIDEFTMQQTSTENITVIQADVSDMVEEVMPAMVSIVNNYTETVNFFGQTFTQEQPSSGSGIIVAQNDAELLIVSNYHVIEGATTLEVTFIDGSTAEAKVKGTDADMDLAVVAVNMDSISGETKNAISVAKLGNSDTLRLGEPVIAIGNALGYGQSVTDGIVSALNREMTLSDGSTGVFVQTNAEINPGNSGGALLNMNGEVIGINSNKIGGSAVEGMGYAIPITSANPIIADLMERQTRNEVAESERGYIGITLQVVTKQNAQMYNMPVGIYVIAVEEGSGAEKAGLVPGDIITRFDGEKLTSSEDLQNILQYFAVGDTAKITIMRIEKGEYVEHEFDITLGERPTGLQ